LIRGTLLQSAQAVKRQQRQQQETSPLQRSSLSIGCGAGFAGDRPDAAIPVVEALVARGGPACLIYETLAERTLALAQLRRRSDPKGGYFQGLAELLRPVLATCQQHRIPIVGNFGAADPAGAAQCIRELAVSLGLPPLRVAAVTGDDLLAALPASDLLAMPFHPPTRIEPQSLVSANVYLGAQGIVEALQAGADVVVTGRVADPALVLGPLVHHHGWSWDDWDRIAAGVLAGHLLECGAQVTGGYYADPGIKDVPDLARVGYPIAEVSHEGVILLGKPAGTGGLVSEATVKEQMLYEIHDPAAYLTPDVVLDLSDVQLEQTGPDLVRITGAKGHERPATLKGTVCFDGGWMGEGEISYAGPNAQARGRLAIDVLRERLALCELEVESHFDLIGVCSVFNDSDGGMLDDCLASAARPSQDVRVRMAVRAVDRAVVARALIELEALYTAGPAGGGGVRTSVTPLMNSTSVYVPREGHAARVTLLEGQP